MGVGSSEPPSAGGNGSGYLQGHWWAAGSTDRPSRGGCLPGLGAPPIGGLACLGSEASEDPPPCLGGPSLVGVFHVSVGPPQHSTNHGASPLPTAIVNPKQPKETPKSFSFDYSYWSHTSVRLGAQGRRTTQPLSRCGPRPVPQPLICMFLSEWGDDHSSALHGPVGGGGGPASLSCLVCRSSP